VTTIGLCGEKRCAIVKVLVLLAFGSVWEEDTCFIKTGSISLAVLDCGKLLMGDRFLPVVQREIVREISFTRIEARI